ncbi:MAG: hypothetical protein OSJ37_02750 [Muribaculaceae bacterium]|nr:hypothetical protein [Muribaculaceae bacterium]
MKEAILRLLSVLLLVSASAVCARAHNHSRGEKSFGPRLGYVSRNSSAYGGLSFEYQLSKVVRVAPRLGLIFRNKDLGGFKVDIDVQFPLDLAVGRACFYPLVGVSYTSWNRHGVHDENSDKDVTNHTNQFGLNAGLGFEYRVSRTLKLSVEGEYTLMRHLPGAFVTAGIAFCF